MEVNSESTLNPKVVVIAGPNGAGKSTSAPAILRGPFQVDHFLNADVIARGLSAFDPDSMAVTAGRIMLSQLHWLAEKRQSFAFETTLASRSFAPWLTRLRATGYSFQIIYLWLADPALAVARVGTRVRAGGHFVPEETVRRRYDRGIANFFELYQSQASHWRWYNNSNADHRKLIASGGIGRKPRIYARDDWKTIIRLWQRESSTPGA